MGKLYILLQRWFILCGEKVIWKFCRWRKNYKYEVCGDIIWANNQGDIIWGGNQRWQESRQATPIRDRGTVQNAEVGSQTDCATIR